MSNSTGTETFPIHTEALYSSFCEYLLNLQMCFVHQLITRQKAEAVDVIISDDVGIQHCVKYKNRYLFIDFVNHVPLSIQAGAKEHTVKFMVGVAEEATARQAIARKLFIKITMGPVNKIIHDYYYIN